MENIFWDKNVPIGNIKKILQDSSDSRFIEYAALLLSRTNDPKMVFKEYINIIQFCKNWIFIKKRMRQNKWSDTRINFWDEIYRVAVKNINKERIRVRKPAKKKIDDKIIEISNILREARKKKGWTQAKASKEIGISQQTISLVERGSLNFSFKTLKKIASSYGLKIMLTSEENGDRHEMSSSFYWQA